MKNKARFSVIFFLIFIVGVIGIFNLTNQKRKITSKELVEPTKVVSAIPSESATPSITPSIIPSPISTAKSRKPTKVTPVQNKIISKVSPSKPNQVDKSVKEMLTQKISNAAKNWPKTGAYTLYSNAETRPYEVYYYDNQIMVIGQIPGIQKSWDSRVLAFDPQYFYIKFPNDTARGKKLLVSNNVESLDWVRFDEGYNLPADKLPYDTVRVKSLLNFPIILANNSLEGADAFHYDAKTKVFSLKGICESQKCFTAISFKSNGFFDKIDYQLAGGRSWTFIANLKAPLKPLIDRTKVLDDSTEKIAIYSD